MAARYYVLVSQELLDADTPWHQAGLELLEQGGFTDPGWRWCLFADENAPAELEGKRVELTFAANYTEGDDGTAVKTAVITDRRVIG